MQNSVSDILALPPQAAYAWVANAISDNLLSQSSFNFHLLAEAMAHRALEENDITHGSAAIALYEALAALPKNSTDSDSFLRSAMHLRAGMIIQFGDQENDPILDSRTLVDWFNSQTQINPEYARSASQNWTTLPVSEIRTLRKIKNNLAPFVMLQKNGQPDLPSEIRNWLEIRNNLP